MAASSSCLFSSAASFQCRSDPDFSIFPKSEIPLPGFGKMGNGGAPTGTGGVYGPSSLILRFPPNFLRQLSTKAWRNCSNIVVAHIVAASWSDGGRKGEKEVGAAAGCAAAAGAAAAAADAAPAVEDGSFCDGSVQFKEEFRLCGGGSLAVHAGERYDRKIPTDAIPTATYNTSAYFFKKTQELLDFKEKRSESYEHGRYGNPTTAVLEEKMSALEGAESSLVLSSGMCASTVLLQALVPAGGHIVTTTDCYRETRTFIETFLPKMGITASVIDLADMEGLETALKNNKVSLFYTESPTNPLLRCVDIKLVSELCHKYGALVCIDGTFATPLNQKALALGADLVLHSATKFIAGHNDVIAGTISGSKQLVTTIRMLRHVLGGVLNPNAAYLIIRGMKTLDLRVQRQNETAMTMAKILEAHPKVKCVYYPGLPSHREHHIAKKQMTGFGGVVSFEVDGDLHRTIKFIDALKIPYIAPSLGGVESIVHQPAIISYWDLSQEERMSYGIKDNLLRFSFGVEDFEDVKSDVLQALDSI